MRYWLSFAPILSPVLNACGTPPPHHQPLEMAPQLLFLGHLVDLVMNPEPDEMSHHTQTSAMVGFPAPAEETGEIALFSSESLFPPGGTERERAMLLKTSQ